MDVISAVSAFCFHFWWYRRDWLAWGSARGNAQNQITFYAQFYHRYYLGFLACTLFFMDSLVHSQSSFLWFWVSCLGYSSFLTIIYKKTKSVLLEILFHTMINALGSLGVQVPMNQNVRFMIYSVILFLLGEVALIYVYRKENVG